MPDRGHRRTLLWRDQHDASLRKAKISAASALLSADVDDVYRLERIPRRSANDLTSCGQRMQQCPTSRVPSRRSTR